MKVHHLEKHMLKTALLAGFLTICSVVLLAQFPGPPAKRSGEAIWNHVPVIYQGELARDSSRGHASRSTVFLTRPGITLDFSEVP